MAEDFQDLGTGQVSEILGEEGATTLCLWRRLWTLAQHSTGPELGMCSATHKSSRLLRWQNRHNSTEVCRCRRRVARCPCRDSNLGGRRREVGTRKNRA